MITSYLGAVVRVNVKGRISNEEKTLFKRVGLAIQYITTALAVYTSAEEKV